MGSLQPLEAHPIPSSPAQGVGSRAADTMGPGAAQEHAPRGVVALGDEGPEPGGGEGSDPQPTEEFKRYAVVERDHCEDTPAVSDGGAPLPFSRNIAKN